MPLTQHEEDYLFDLRGFLVLDQALTRDQVTRINRWVDDHPAGAPGSWIGDVQIHTYGQQDGTNYQNIIEGGPVFEELIDHPAWIGKVRRWIESDFNRVSLQECFLNLRPQSGWIGIHSGGHVPAPVMTFRHPTGAWQVGQINILMALEDIGPGDGATVVVPGSHKATIVHPDLVDSPQSTYRDDRAAGGALGSIEVHLKAGQAVLFTDAVSHGAAARTNPGRRRVLIYRYTPHWLMQRYHYLPSPGLLDRLTPERRAIVQPIPHRAAPDRLLGERQALGVGEG